MAFERNSNGHVVIAITGLNLTGEQEIARLLAAGYRVPRLAKFCFLAKRGLFSTTDDGYDTNHRLVADRLYKIALVPGKEIVRDLERTRENLRKIGMQKYGYGEPLGGHIPRIREVVSDEMMREMGTWSITSPHNPIQDCNGHPNVFNANRCCDGRYVNARRCHSNFYWDDHRDMFAFPII